MRRRALAVVLCVAAALAIALQGLGARSAWAADVEAISSVSWTEAKPRIEAVMGTPYVWGGKDTSGWDCSGFVGWVLAEVYGVGWPGGSPALCGTDAVKLSVQESWVFHGTSAEDFNGACDAGTVKPGDVVIFYNRSGYTVHCAIVGEGQTIYHAWSEKSGTCHRRFDEVWVVNGGHGKVYASFDVYRGLDDAGRIRLLKSSALPDATEGSPCYSLEGAEYAVFDAWGSQVATLVTDAAGAAGPTGDLPAGTYSVRETKAPNGFLPDERTYEVELAEGSWDAERTVLVTPDAERPLLAAGVTVRKHDAETAAGDAQGGGSLAGAEFLFQHYAVDPSSVDDAADLDGIEPDMTGVATTGADGTATLTSMTTADGSRVDGVPLGALVVSELEAPDGYLPSGERQLLKVTSADGATASVELEASFAEQVVRGGVRVEKRDAETGEGAPQGSASLDGATFEVVNASAAAVVAGGEEVAPGEVAVTLVTEGGVAEMAPDALPYGDYLLREVTAPEGYVAGVGEIPFSIEKNGQVVELSGERAVTNHVARGGVSIWKNDAEMPEGVAQGSASLDGATFEVVNASAAAVVVDGERVEPGEVALTLVTEGGVARSAPDALPYGAYAVREASAPEGYLGTDSEVSFSITEDGQSVELRGERAFVNRIARGGVRVEKSDADLGAGSTQGSGTLDGAVFEVVNASAAAVVVEGEEVAPGEVAVTLVTEGGVAETAPDSLPYGDYLLREVAAPEGYVISGDEHPFSISSNGQMVEFVGERSIPNRVARGGVVIAKGDAETGDGTAQGSATIDGATFEVVNASAAPVVVDGNAVAPGEVALTLVTEGGVARSAPDALPCGDYLVREVTAPEGYLGTDEERAFSVTKDGQVVELVGELGFTNRVMRGGVRVEKRDAETGEGSPQGAGTLDGAALEIVNASSAPVIISGAEVAPGEVVATIVTEGGVAETAPDALPYGDYLVREVTASAGYLVTEGELPFSVRENGEVVELTGESGIAERVIRGGVLVAKNDAETGENAPQGSASVDGAVFEVVNASAEAVVVNGEAIAPGRVAATIVTEEGVAATPGDLLPYGDYLVREVSAPEGYLGTDSETPFSIREEGVVVELTGERAVANLVRRGDLELVKVSDGDLGRMAGVPFSVTSATTGESHVIVTDDNGYASTAAAWNPHTQRTNANDGAEEGSLDAGAGVWFGACAPDDGRGALPYDTYAIQELPCAANEGKVLLGPIEVRVYRDAVTVSMGTLTNDDEGGPRTQISKLDVTGSEELPGATLQILDAEGSVVEEWVSTDEPHEVRLDPGSYTLHEEIAPEGHLIASDVEFEVVEGKVLTQVAMVDDHTRTEFEKVDAESGAYLPGATLQIVDDEGAVVEEWVSEDEPHRVEALAPGDYLLREKSAPEGYELAEDVPFTVEATAEVKVVTMVDSLAPEPEEPEPEEPEKPEEPHEPEKPERPEEVPGTGDSSWVLPAGCAIGALACMTGAAVMGRHRASRRHHRRRRP